MLLAAAAAMVVVLAARDSVARPAYQAGDRRQTMLVPLPAQAALVERILTFDRSLETHEDTTIDIVVLYQPEYRASRDAQAQLAAFAASARATAWGRPIRWRFLALVGGEALGNAFTALSVDAVYLTPVRAVDVRSLADAAAAQNAALYSGVPDYLQHGVAVSFGVQASRPRIRINLDAAKRAGADFSSQLLQLADVSRDAGRSP